MPSSRRMTKRAIQRDIRRFLTYCEPDPKSECILFMGHRDNKGYGRFRTRILPTVRGMVKAHRLAYHIVRGPIPEDFTIDHVAARGCKYTSCVNAYHLEAISRAENARRGNLDRRTKHERRPAWWEIPDGDLEL